VQSQIEERENGLVNFVSINLHGLPPSSCS
jgi:hypothetical protein